MRRGRISLILVLAAASAAAATDFDKGKLIENVTCLIDPSQTYTLFLPTQYTTERKWPLLFIFDPRGRGTRAAELFREAAEANSWILLSSNNTQSDTTWDVNEKAVRAMVPELRRFSVDEKRLYAAGFSGGATVAWSLGQTRATLAGVIAAGEPCLEELDASRARFAWFGTVGSIDFNNSDVRMIDRDVAKSGKPHHLEIFEGPHHWMPEAVAREAVEWMELQAMREGRRTVDTLFVDRLYKTAMSRADDALRSGNQLAALRAYDDAGRDFEGLHDTSEAHNRAAALEGSARVKEQRRREQKADAYEERTLAAVITNLRALIGVNRPMPLASMERQLDLPAIKRTASEAGEAGLAAKRVLERLFIETAFYLPEQYFGKHDYSRAATMLLIAASLKPESYAVQYDLARALARLGRTNAALDALERAIALGFPDRAAAEKDRDFLTLRGEPRFGEILNHP
jgi:tetratricopeptide (TPR) repeat protein